MVSPILSGFGIVFLRRALSGVMKRFGQFGCAEHVRDALDVVWHRSERNFAFHDRGSNLTNSLLCSMVNRFRAFELDCSLGLVAAFASAQIFALAKYPQQFHGLQRCLFWLSSTVLNRKSSLSNPTSCFT
jgi:hypothetical protein